jgi:uncharacterized protein with PQ loop repeat
MNEFMTGEVLATFVGLVTAVTIIVQFTKSILKRKCSDSSVRIYAFIIALILTFIFAKNGVGPKGIVLTIINAVLITTASTGAYEMIADPKAEKAKADNIKQAEAAEYDKVNFSSETQKKTQE